MFFVPELYCSSLKSVRTLHFLLTVLERFLMPDLFVEFLSKIKFNLTNLIPTMNKSEVAHGGKLETNKSCRSLLYTKDIERVILPIERDSGAFIVL